MPNKYRWKRTAGGERRRRFSYRGDGTGRIVFYRFDVPFSWKPLFVDRESARNLIDQLNLFDGKDLERIGRPTCDRFYAKHKNNAGPAEPGNKGT